MRGWVIRACADVAGNTEKNERKMDKSLCVLRVFSNDFVPKITGKSCIFLQNPLWASDSVEVNRG